MLTKRVSSLFAIALLFLLLATPFALADDSNGGTIASIIGGVCCGIVYLGIYIYLIYFVYTDATSRGQNAILWAILTAIPCLTFWVFIAWLIMRPARNV